MVEADDDESAGEVIVDRDEYYAVKKDAERYRALRRWHDAPGIPEFDLDEGADALIESTRENAGAGESGGLLNLG